MKFLKQLFCKHKWKIVEETYNYITFECTKCGKRETDYDNYYESNYSFNDDVGDI